MAGIDWNWALVADALASQRMCLVLLYSFRCDLSCEYCCTSSSPVRNGCLSLPIASEAVAAARDVGIPEVQISGGEPMLYRDDISGLIGLSQSAGLSVSMITNANWATTLHTARTEVRHLVACGLSHLGVSVDRFHLRQVPLERPLWVIQACQEEGLSCRVELGELPGDGTGILDTLLEKHCPCSEIRKAMPVGRGLRLLKNLDHESVGLQTCRVACSLTVDPRGNVYPCCGAPGLPSGDQNVLRLGSIRNEPAGRVFERVPLATSVLLSVFGPVWLLQRLARSASIDPPSDYRSICEACVMLFRDPWRERMADYASSHEAWASLQCARIARDWRSGSREQ